jgi:hypothetical protein
VRWKSEKGKQRETKMFKMGKIDAKKFLSLWKQLKLRGDKCRVEED